MKKFLNFLNEAPATLRSGYLLPALRRERNPSEAEIVSHSSASLRSRFSAKGDNNRGETLVFIFLAAIILRFVISWPFYSGDVTNHLRWGTSILEQGIIGFYTRDFSPHSFQTYPPIGMLPFAFSIVFYDFFQKIIWVLNILIPIFPSDLVFFFQQDRMIFAFLKLSAILGDLGIAYFLFRFSKRYAKERVLDIAIPALYLFNPVVFYLSSNWGQIESLPLAFGLGAFFYLFEKRPRASIIFLALSLLSKQTAIIFFPVYGIVFLKSFGVKRSFLALGGLILIFWATYLPFGFINPVETILFYKQTFSYVSDRVQENAFNLWMLIFGFEKPFDRQIFLGIPLKFWGYILFFLFSLPVFFTTFKKPQTKTTTLILGYLVLAAFLFLTRMHERYLAFSLPFLLLSVLFFRKMILVYILVSLTHFINLYNGFFQPSIKILDSLLLNINFIRFIVLINFSSFLALLINVARETKVKVGKNAKV